MIQEAFWGILIPFLGTSLGAGCVFFLKKSLSDDIQRALTGFAAGVMVAASVWSLLIPAMEQAADLGRLAFFPAAVGFWLGILFLLLLDMTDELPKVAAHWKSLDLRFQAIYSGFLGSERQIGIVADFIRDFRREDTVVVVDPVMGDHGKVYQTYTSAMCDGTACLAEQADIITPNLTEAALLLGLPYRDVLMADCREIAERLSLDGRRSVVLTGASTREDWTGAACFDSSSGRTEMIETRRVPREFHGTGDVFASVLTGALLQGNPLPQATRRAVEFIRVCAERTAAQDLPMREGVDFEPLLGLLTGGKPIA